MIILNCLMHSFYTRHPFLVFKLVIFFLFYTEFYPESLPIQLYNSNIDYGIFILL